VNRWINKLVLGVAGGFFGQAQVNNPDQGLSLFIRHSQKADDSMLK
jgi:hypothetical protein